MVQSGETDAHMICRQAALTLTHDPAPRSRVSAHAHAADTTKKHTSVNAQGSQLLLGVAFSSVHSRPVAGVTDRTG